MHITLNGEEKITSSKNIEELLDEYNQKKAAIVVEVNLDIIAKNNYQSTPIKNGDKIEFIRFMGGG